MLNKAKIIAFDLWDEDTGEATVTASFEGGKELKCFTIDEFEEGQTYEVRLSFFCNQFEITDQSLSLSIDNKDEFRAVIQGLIVDFSSGDEDGDIITVDVGNIYLSVYVSFADIEKHRPEMGIYFKGEGRLDLEFPYN